MTRDTVVEMFKKGIKPAEIARAIGVSKQRVDQLLFPEKHKAREAVQLALRRRDLKIPKFCSNCKILGPVAAHHEDYKKPLEVVWLCSTCHGRRHVEMRSNKSTSRWIFQRDKDGNLTAIRNVAVSLSGSKGLGVPSEKRT